jgi:hypothetical protein
MERPDPVSQFYNEGPARSRRQVIGDATGFIHLLSREDGSLLNRLNTDGTPTYAPSTVGHSGRHRNGRHAWLSARMIAVFRQKLIYLMVKPVIALLAR